MNTIDAFEYKGNEIIILEEPDGCFVVDIRSDDYDGELMQGYFDLGSESEAISVGKAFVDGLKNNVTNILTEEQQINHVVESLRLSSADIAFKAFQHAPTANLINMRDMIIHILNHRDDFKECSCNE